MKLLVGLGNPGTQYKNTRHNVGYMLVDHLLHNISSDLNFEASSKLGGDVCATNEYIFFKSHSHMNTIGNSVAKAISYYKVANSDLYLLHDDLDIPFTNYKLQFDRSAAGHHGVEDVIKKLGTTAFWRFRFGIGKPAIGSTEDFVLGKFTVDEQIAFENAVKTIELQTIIGG